MTAVHQHTGGHGHDDMALLLLEHGATSWIAANGQSPAAQAAVRTVAGTQSPPGHRPTRPASPTAPSADGSCRQSQGEVVRATRPRLVETGAISPALKA